MINNPTPSSCTPTHHLYSRAWQLPSRNKTGLDSSLEQRELFLARMSLLGVPAQAWAGLLSDPVPFCRTTVKWKMAWAVPAGNLPGSPLPSAASQHLL